MRAYFEAAARRPRARKIVIPDTAHGTNPASVDDDRLRAVTASPPTPAATSISADLRAKVDGETAGLMLTNPSTLGLFDENIEECATLPRGGRADVLRRRQPERRLRHLAARRHGLRHRPHQPAQDLRAARTAAAAPAAGPFAVSAGWRRFCRCPSSRATARATGSTTTAPHSIGKVRGFAGPFGVFVRSYAFMRAWGPACAR